MMIWWNGQLLEEDAVRLSPMDHGFLVGDGVFETLLARHGRPYAVRRHWQRLCRSGESMDIAVPDEAVFRQGLEAVLAASGLDQARLRVTVTSGAGPAGSERGGGPGTVCMTATSLKAWGAVERLVWSPWPRPTRGALTGVKSTSYGENVRALALARSQDAGEALFVNDLGQVCEGTGSNVFWVRQGRVETPPLTSGCLAGVTRGLVIELAQRLGLAVAELDLPQSDLTPRHCDEVFLTSTTRDVQPVAQISEQAWPAPGPVTTRLRDAFLEWQAADSDP